jgi:hypothetical protein
MHATIFGNVASIVARIYRRRQEYDMKVRPGPILAQKVRLETIIRQTA